MTDDQIKHILKNSKTIAMIGVSSEKKGEDKKNLKRKPANVVMKYMQDFGYKVYPINPFAVGEVIHGEKVYKSLESISDKIDIVDVFRPSKEVNEKLAVEMKSIEFKQQNYDVNISSKLDIGRSVFNPLIGGEISISEGIISSKRSKSRRKSSMASGKNISRSILKNSELQGNFLLQCYPYIFLLR